MKRRLIALLLVAAMTILCLPIVHAEEDVVTIFHTNDMHAYITEAEGTNLNLANVAYLHKNTENSLLIDAGDFDLGGSNYGGITSGASVFESMDVAGYDMGILGNHEFDKSVANFEEQVKRIHYPIISSNIYIKEGYEEVSPYLASMDKTKIFEVNGHKIGFFSIDTPTMRGMVAPSTLDAGGVVVRTDIIDVAEECVAELKAAGVDVIIAVNHCGYTPIDNVESETELNSYHIAKVEGVDAVIDAHDHEYRLGDEAVDVDGTLLVSTGCYLKALGALELKFYDDGSVAITSRDATEDAKQGVDEDTKAKMDEWQQYIDDMANEVVFKSEANFWGGNVPGFKADDSSLTVAVARRGYTNGMQLIADASQDKAQKWFEDNKDKADFADTDLSKAIGVVAYFGGGSVRGTFFKGDVTYGQLNSAYSFSFDTDGGCNYILVSPKTLWMLLEHGVNFFYGQDAETGMLSANGSIHGRFPGFSGLTYTYDITQTPSGEADNDLVPTTIGNRIQSVTLADGTELDKNDNDSRIMLVIGDYNIGGGDGYWMLGLASDWDGYYSDTLYEEPVGEGWLLIDYVNEKWDGTIPADAYPLYADNYKRVNDPYTKDSFDSTVTVTSTSDVSPANITCTAAVDGGDPVEYTTDEEGKFVIEGLANGAHEVVVTVQGNETDGCFSGKTNVWYLDNYAGLVNIHVSAEVEEEEEEYELVVIEEVNLTQPELAEGDVLLSDPEDGNAPGIVLEENDQYDLLAAYWVEESDEEGNILGYMPIEADLTAETGKKYRSIVILYSKALEDLFTPIIEDEEEFRKFTADAFANIKAEATVIPVFDGTETKFNVEGAEVLDSVVDFAVDEEGNQGLLVALVLETEVPEENPDTADSFNSRLWSVVALVSAAGLVVLRKKDLIG